MHTAANCHREYRCVKCGKSHEAGQCAVRDAKKLKCANCGKNHSANNLSECEFFRKEILPLSKKNRIRQTEKPKIMATVNNKKKNARITENVAKPMKTTKSNSASSETNNNIYSELNRIEERITEKIMQLWSNGPELSTSSRFPARARLGLGRILIVHARARGFSEHEQCPSETRSSAHSLGLLVPRNHKIRKIVKFAKTID